MMTISENTIALLGSRTSSTRNRALLHVGITDGNVDNAVALFNCKPDESFWAALSWPAAQFRRSLANGAKGYWDKYRVLYTFADNESEVEVDSVLTGGYEHGEVRGYGENLY